MNLVICAIVKNELDLDEWVDFHLGVGVDRIHLLNNGDDFKLDRRGGRVRVTRVPGAGDGFQINAYNTWTEHSSYGVDWCAYIDADEFLYAPAGLKAAIEFASLAGNNATAIGVRWKVFGSSGHLFRQPSVLFAYRHRQPLGSNKHVKTIAMPAAKPVFPANPHRTSLSTVDVDGWLVEGHETDCMSDRLMIYHYCYKSREDIRLKMARGDANRGPGFRNTEYDMREESFCTVLDESLSKRHRPAGAPPGGPILE